MGAAEGEACACAVTRPQRQPHALGGRQLGIDVGEPLLRLEHGVAELDERVARDEVGRRLVGRGRGRVVAGERDLLLQLEHDALGRLLADPGDRLEAGVILERDRAPELGGGRAGDDGERDLGADPADREQLR